MILGFQCEGDEAHFLVTAIFEEWADLSLSSQTRSPAWSTCFWFLFACRGHADRVERDDQFGLLRFVQCGALMGAHTNEGDGGVVGLELGQSDVGCRWPGILGGAIQRLGGDHGSAEIAFRLLGEKQLNRDVAVGGVVIDRG